MAYQSKTPTWAFAVGLLLIPCTMFLSLLFLLVKDRQVDGHATVELVTRGGQGLSQQVYVNSTQALSNLRHAVRHAQGWAISAPPV